jgi:hypothetical protein
VKLTTRLSLLHTRISKRIGHEFEKKDLCTSTENVFYVPGSSVEEHRTRDLPSIRFQHYLSGERKI